MGFSLHLLIQLKYADICISFHRVLQYKYFISLHPPYDEATSQVPEEAQCRNPHDLTPHTLRSTK